MSKNSWLKVSLFTGMDQIGHPAVALAGAAPQIGHPGATHTISPAEIGHPPAATSGNPGQTGHPGPVVTPKPQEIGHPIPPVSGGTPGDNFHAVSLTSPHMVSRVTLRRGSDGNIYLSLEE
jgi:hypothetical protein